MLRGFFVCVYLKNQLRVTIFGEIKFIERDMQVTRNTASKYLQMIVDTGLVEKVKVGKTNYYFNTKLIDLFLNHNSKVMTSVESIESVLDLCIRNRRKRPIFTNKQ